MARRKRTTHKSTSVARPASPPSLQSDNNLASPQATSSPPLFSRANVMTETIHEGPLPPPQLMREYGAIVPQGAERIFNMAEAEQRHRHAMEHIAMNSDADVKSNFQRTEEDRIKGIFASDSRGQYLGAFLSALAILGCIYAALNGVDWRVCLGLVSLPVLGMVNAITASYKKTNLKIPTDESTE